MAVAVPIISTFDNKGIRLAENAFGGLSKKALAMGTAVAGAFAGVAKGMYEMVQAAAEDQKSFTLLAQTLSKVTGASAEMSAQVDKQIGKMAMATGIIGMSGAARSRWRPISIPARASCRNTGFRRCPACPPSAALPMRRTWRSPLPSCVRTRSS